MRCLIERVTIAVIPTEQIIDVSIRWAGGFESRHNLRRPVSAYEQLDDFDRLSDRVAELRRAGWRSTRIAAQLNAEGFQTPKKRRGIHSRRGPLPMPTHPERTGKRRNRSPTTGMVGGRPGGPLNIPVKKLKDWVRFGWVRAIARPFGGTWILHADERKVNQLQRRAALSRKGHNYPPEFDRETV